MTNDDFQLEELENAAVNKSNNAKRAAAIGAAVAGSGAMGVAGKAIYDNVTDNHENPADALTPEDLDSAAQVGADQVQAPQETQPEPAPRVSQQPAEPAPHPAPEPPEDEIDITFDKTTHIYDEDNQLLATTEDGTLEGKNFTLIDLDEDMQADILAYDADGSGDYTDNEIVRLTGDDQIQMGNATTRHEDIFVQLNEPESEPFVDPIDPYNLEDEKDLAEEDRIHNDFEDEKTGESYSHDYAENNENYNNNGDVEHYAGMGDMDYEEKIEEPYDEEYDDTLASNDLDDSSDFDDDHFDDFA